MKQGKLYEIDTYNCMQNTKSRCDVNPRQYIISEDVGVMHDRRLGHQGKTKQYHEIITGLHPPTGVTGHLVTFIHFIDILYTTSGPLYCFPSMNLYSFLSLFREFFHIVPLSRKGLPRSKFL